jgi:hypothetical protein
MIFGGAALQRCDRDPLTFTPCHSEPLAAGETGESERENTLCLGHVHTLSKCFEKEGGTSAEAEGLTVTRAFLFFLVRDALLYKEGNRRMTINIDWGTAQIVVFRVSIGRWEDDPAKLVDDATRLRIENNVKRALEWLGWSVSFQ